MAARTKDGKRGGKCRLIGTGDPAASSNSSDGALDDPAARLDGKALLAVVRPNDLDRDDGSVADPLSLIGPIGEVMHQERPQTARRPQQRDPAVAVVPIRG